MISMHALKYSGRINIAELCDLTKAYIVREGTPLCIQLYPKHAVMYERNLLHGQACDSILLIIRSEKLR